MKSVYAFSVVVAFLSLFAAAGCGTKPKPKSQHLTAEELVRVFEVNQLEADLIYKGKTAVIQGKVEHITLSKNDGYVLTLVNRYTLRPKVQCFLNTAEFGEQFVGLRHGHTVTVRGTVQGIVSEPNALTMTNCCLLDR